jgi:hypothetical protein
MGPARGAWPFEARILLAVALRKIKFHPGIWGCDRPDNALK